MRPIPLPLSLAIVTALVLGIPASARTAQSNFTNSAEGWLLEGEAVGPIWEAAGGHPGGYITASSVSGGEAWYWRAPSKFLGNHAEAYGRTLTFDVRAVAFDPSNRADVVLKGGGLTLTYDCHGPSMGGWTTYTIPLTETAGWTKLVAGKRVPPSAMDFRVVLANIEELRIRGEGGSMMANSDLDTVVLRESPEGPGTIPAGDALPMLLGASLLIGLVQARRQRSAR